LAPHLGRVQHHQAATHAKRLAPPAEAATAAAAFPPPTDVTALVPLVPVTASPLASNPFAGMTADQILEMAIARPRGAIGEDAAPPPAGQPFRLGLNLGSDIEILRFATVQVPNKCQLLLALRRP